MLVISYGGSLIFDGDQLNKNVSDFLTFLEGRSAVVVTGGGTVARTYINAAKVLGISDAAQLDRLAIEVTRMNASLLQRVLSERRSGVSSAIPFDEASLLEEMKKSKVVFMGGTVPGQTTDMVALKVCAALGEKKLYNLTKVDGIFDSNPHENPDAELIEQATCSEIEKTWGIDTHTPGLNYPIEPRALSFAREKNVEMFVLNGNDMANLRSLLDGKRWRGTHLLPE